MQGTNTQSYIMVSTIKKLKRVLMNCRHTLTALDFETTSLSPADGRVRLVSLKNDNVNALVDFDLLRGGFRNTAKHFAKLDWIVFNAGFEMRWFQDAGVQPNCYDVGNLRKAILGGGNYSLKYLVKSDLGIDMSKEEQASDWSKPVLSQEQLDYAFFDAVVTKELWDYWYGRADEGHMGGFRMFNDMVPAVIEMETAGMLLNQSNHRRLIKEWTQIKREKERTLRTLVKRRDVTNINSNIQWSDFFSQLLPDKVINGWPRTEKTGHLSMEGDVLSQLAGKVPAGALPDCLDALAAYKTVSKYLSSFGETLLNSAAMAEDNRIHARFNIGAAKTGRFSCSGPNLQQVPRDKEVLGTMTSVRSSFKSAPNCRLVSLDYSGIELRTLALLSGDKQLLEDVVYGDVHAEVAAVIAGKAIDKSTFKGKQARQDAKGVSFGIIYGSGATGLAATMRTTLERSQSYIDFWQDRYPDAFNLRYAMVDEATRSRYLRMVDGGTIYMGKKIELPKCSNYPVQRAAMSIMARAITRHKNSLDEQRKHGHQKQTLMLSTIHDALIDEAATSDAKRCLKIMDKDMVAAYLDIFPGAPTDKLVEGGIGSTWANLE